MTTPLIDNIGPLAFSFSVGLFLGCLAVYAIMSDRPDDEGSVLSRVKEQLGLQGIPSAFVVFGLICWLLVFCILLFGLMWMVLDMLSSPARIATEEPANWRFLLAKVASLTAILAAVIAFPLTLIKVKLTRQQTIAAEQGLITDRIGKAIDQLGHDDTAVRMGAIHSLERIMIDSVEDRVMVMRTLNAYLKHRRSENTLESTEEVPELDIDVQAALDAILRWAAE